MILMALSKFPQLVIQSIMLIPIKTNSVEALLMRLAQWFCPLLKFYVNVEFKLSDMNLLADFEIFTVATIG